MGGLFSSGPSASLTANNAINESLSSAEMNNTLNQQQNAAAAAGNAAYAQETATLEQQENQAQVATPPASTIGAYASTVTPGSSSGLAGGNNSNSVFG
jgi:hypothetical protein